MKKLFILLFVITSLSARAQDCKDVKTGSFKIAADEVNPAESILTRTAEHQFEEVKSKGIKMQFDIKWTSDCSYELSKPKVLKGQLPYVSDDQVLYVRITKVTDSYYTAEISSNFSDLKFVKDIQIIKK